MDHSIQYNWTTTWVCQIPSFIFGKPKVISHWTIQSVVLPGRLPTMQHFCPHHCLHMFLIYRLANNPLASEIGCSAAQLEVAATGILSYPITSVTGMIETRRANKNNQPATDDLANRIPLVIEQLAKSYLLKSTSELPVSMWADWKTETFEVWQSMYQLNSWRYYFWNEKRTYIRD